ncbi:MAG: hypothetical protein DRH08_09300 [Deltaproteobacteria bacterium]|nr:MAG: hypothetical protein DRH08_09300 [Deltaproteobacteria bacterium]
MARRRPCKICGRWFKPDPRSGRRQQVCSSKTCQKERHRRNCKTWRQNNYEAEQAHKIRQNLLIILPENPDPAHNLSSVKKLNWEKARQVVGLEIAVLVEEATKMPHFLLRDSVPP